MIDQDKPATTELVVTQRPKSVLLDMANRYGMEPVPFEATVRAICMPANSTREEFAAFLLVAKEYKLNPLTKEIYAFPKRGGGIVPIVSIDGWVSLVNSHPACDGFTFSWMQDDKGDPISCTCIMFRKDRSHPVEVTEYLAECIRPTDPWKMKHRMLRHKAMIQGARYAFGFSGIYDEDEGAKIAEAPPIKDITPPSPPSPPPAPTIISETSNEGGKINTAADDASDDDSGLTAEPETVDQFIARIDTELSFCRSASDVEEGFDGLEIPVHLENDADRARAFAIKAKHLDRVGVPFPGDTRP